MKNLNNIKIIVEAIKKYNSNQIKMNNKLISQEAIM
jgi:hypothetical protein